MIPKGYTPFSLQEETEQQTNLNRQQHIDTPLATTPFRQKPKFGETLWASARYENVPYNFFRSWGTADSAPERISNFFSEPSEVELSFNPYNYYQDNEGQYKDLEESLRKGYFEGVRTEEQFVSRADRLRRILHDQQLAYEGHGLAAFIGGTLGAAGDPLVFVPVRTTFTALQTMNRAYRFAFVGGYVGAASGGMATAQEVALQMLQEPRTLEETMANIAFASVIGFGIGGTLGAFIKNREKDLFGDPVDDRETPTPKQDGGIPPEDSGGGGGGVEVYTASPLDARQYSFLDDDGGLHIEQTRQLSYTTSRSDAESLHAEKLDIKGENDRLDLGDNPLSRGDVNDHEYAKFLKERKKRKDKEKDVDKRLENAKTLFDLDEEIKSSSPSTRQRRAFEEEQKARDKVRDDLYSRPKDAGEPPSPIKHIHKRRDYQDVDLAAAISRRGDRQLQRYMKDNFKYMNEMSIRDRGKGEDGRNKVDIFNFSPKESAKSAYTDTEMKEKMTEALDVLKDTAKRDGFNAEESFDNIEKEIRDYKHNKPKKETQVFEDSWDKHVAQTQTVGDSSPPETPKDSPQVDLSEPAPEWVEVEVKEITTGGKRDTDSPLVYEEFERYANSEATPSAKEVGDDLNFGSWLKNGKELLSNYREEIGMPEVETDFFDAKVKVAKTFFRISRKMMHINQFTLKLGAEDVEMKTTLSYDGGLLFRRAIREMASTKEYLRTALNMEGLKDRVESGFEIRGASFGYRSLKNFTEGNIKAIGSIIDKSASVSMGFKHSFHRFQEEYNKSFMPLEKPVSDDFVQDYTNLSNILDDLNSDFDAFVDSFVKGAEERIDKDFIDVDGDSIVLEEPLGISSSDKQIPDSPIESKTEVVNEMPQHNRLDLYDDKEIGEAIINLPDDEDELLTALVELPPPHLIFIGTKVYKELKTWVDTDKAKKLLVDRGIPDDAIWKELNKLKTIANVYSRIEKNKDKFVVAHAMKQVYKERMKQAEKNIDKKIKESQEKASERSIIESIQDSLASIIVYRYIAESASEAVEKLPPAKKAKAKAKLKSKPKPPPKPEVKAQEPPPKLDSRAGIESMHDWLLKFHPDLVGVSIFTKKTKMHDWDADERIIALDDGWMEGSVSDSMYFSETEKIKNPEIPDELLKPVLLDYIKNRQTAMDTIKDEDKLYSALENLEDAYEKELHKIRKENNISPLGEVVESIEIPSMVMHPKSQDPYGVYQKILKDLAFTADRSGVEIDITITRVDPETIRNTIYNTGFEIDEVIDQISVRIFRAPREVPVKDARFSPEEELVDKLTKTKERVVKDEVYRLRIYNDKELAGTLGEFDSNPQNILDKLSTYTQEELDDLRGRIKRQVQTWEKTLMGGVDRHLAEDITSEAKRAIDVYRELKKAVPQRETTPTSEKDINLETDTKIPDPKVAKTESPKPDTNPSVRLPTKIKYNDLSDSDWKAINKHQNDVMSELSYEGKNIKQTLKLLSKELPETSKAMEEDILSLIALSRVADGTIFDKIMKDLIKQQTQRIHHLAYSHKNGNKHGDWNYYKRHTHAMRKISMKIQAVLSKHGDEGLVGDSVRYTAHIDMQQELLYANDKNKSGFPTEENQSFYKRLWDWIIDNRKNILGDCV